MRHAGNFNPEWGCLVPAPSFLRSVRLVVVAAAIGATASAAVVFSLADRPAAEETVAARLWCDQVECNRPVQPRQRAACRLPHNCKRNCKRSRSTCRRRRKCNRQVCQARSGGKARLLLLMRVRLLRLAANPASLPPPSVRRSPPCWPKLP